MIKLRLCSLQQAVMRAAVSFASVYSDAYGRIWRQGMELKIILWFNAKSIFVPAKISMRLRSQAGHFEGVGLRASIQQPAQAVPGLPERCGAA